jgi:hypothetical protein
MAKLTLTFKGKRLQTVQLTPGETSIGRDPSNTMQIDSLAVAPHHAMVLSSPEGKVIRSTQDHLTFLVQGHRVTEHKLGHGDLVIIGKHTLIYTEDDFPTDVPETPEAVTADSEDIESWLNQRTLEGSFQVLNGKQMGLVIPLKKALTRLGREDSGVVVIAKRKEGFFITPLAEHTHLSINDIHVNDDTVLLNDGDVVKINHSLLQFFQKKSSIDESSLIEQPFPMNKRNFHRVAHDAKASLSDGKHIVSGKVIDLSLKGCLVELDTDELLSVGDLPYLIRIHLSETIEIVMEATLAHSKGTRVGFVIRHIDLDSVCALRRLVELNLGEAELLDRDIKALVNYHEH